MFEQGEGITPNMTVRHDDGLTYRVDQLVHSADGYEEAGVLSGSIRVIYTQLEQGSHPAGMQWDRDSEEFRKFFTPLDSAE